MHWLHPRNFNRSEWAWIIGYFLVVASLSTLPYTLFYASTPIHQQYQWASVFYHDDYYQYYAWARHMADGDWLIRNYYTDNPNASFALFNPYFLVLGWTTRITGNVYFAYHFLRVVGIAFFAYISYAFLALFLDQPRERRLAQVLFLGGGLEYPYYLLRAHILPMLPEHLPTPLADPYIFKVLYRYGHLTAALCLVLFIFGSHLNVIREKAKGRHSLPTLITLSLAITLLGLINPYYLVLIAAVLATHACWLLYKKEFNSLIPVAAVGLGCLTPFLHYRSQPLSSSLGSISFDDPINLGDFLLFFAPLLCLAGWELWNRGKQQAASTSRTNAAFLICWFVAVIGLILIPLPFKARMVFGLQIPFCIAAALLCRTNPARLIYWPIYALMACELAFTFYKESVDFNDKHVGRLDRSMLAAFAFLDEHATSSDVVLAPAELGFYLPAFTHCSTYVGHSFQTENYYDKDKAVISFFSRMNSTERNQFLHDMRVQYMLVPPMYNAQKSNFESPDWPKVYDRFGYEIYRRR